MLFHATTLKKERRIRSAEFHSLKELDDPIPGAQFYPSKDLVQLFRMLPQTLIKITSPERAKSGGVTEHAGVLKEPTETNFGFNWLSPASFFRS